MRLNELMDLFLLYSGKFLVLSSMLASWLFKPFAIAITFSNLLDLALKRGIRLYHEGL